MFVGPLNNGDNVFFEIKTKSGANRLEFLKMGLESELIEDLVSEMSHGSLLIGPKGIKVTQEEKKEVKGSSTITRDGQVY